MFEGPAVVMTIGVMRLFAARATMSRSKRISSSPGLTVCPGSTITWKPRPSTCTVSIPTCTRPSTPSDVRIETACPPAGTVVTSPAHGARTVLEVGSIARPSPSMRPANTGSGTSSSGAHQPSSGERIVKLAMRASSTDLHPIECPHRSQPRSGESEADIMTSRACGQCNWRQSHLRCACAGRGECCGGSRRAFAPIDAHLELAVRCARISDTNLVDVGTDLKVERQRASLGNELRTAGEIDIAVDPARIHDVERVDGLLTCASRTRFEEQ